MAAVVRGVWNGIREKGLSKFLRYAGDEGFFKCLLDGNLLQTKIHNIGATLVGVDKFGNKYYEKLHDTQYGRHRWVEYAEKGRYNASQVPPEWHGWLHHITDSTGDKLLEQKPKAYSVEHKENFSGEGEGVDLPLQGAYSKPRTKGLDKVPALGTEERTGLLSLREKRAKCYPIPCVFLLASGVADLKQLLSFLSWTEPE